MRCLNNITARKIDIPVATRSSSKLGRTERAYVNSWTERYATSLASSLAVKTL